jgi:hypothetical protein
MSETSVFHLKEELTGADAVKKSADCESSQSFHSQQTRELRRSLRKKQLAPLPEEQCGSSQNVSTCSNALATRTNGNKYILKIVKLKDERLDLQCDNLDNLENFVGHVSLYITEVEIRVNEAQEGVYACLPSLKETSQSFKMEVR